MSLTIQEEETRLEFFNKLLEASVKVKVKHLFNLDLTSVINDCVLQSQIKAMRDMTLQSIQKQGD